MTATFWAFVCIVLKSRQTQPVRRKVTQHFWAGFPLDLGVCTRSTPNCISVGLTPPQSSRMSGVHCWCFQVSVSVLYIYMYLYISCFSLWVESWSRSLQGPPLIKLTGWRVDGGGVSCCCFRLQTEGCQWFEGVPCCCLTSHIRLLFLYRSMCSGDTRRPVNGPISVPALIQVLEKIPSPSPAAQTRHKPVRDPLSRGSRLSSTTSLQLASVWMSFYLELSSERWSPHWVKPGWTVSAPLDTKTALKALDPFWSPKGFWFIKTL